VRTVYDQFKKIMDYISTPKSESPTIPMTSLIFLAKASKREHMIDYLLRAKFGNLAALFLKKVLFPSDPIPDPDRITHLLKAHADTITSSDSKNNNNNNSSNKNSGNKNSNNNNNNSNNKKNNKKNGVIETISESSLGEDEVKAVSAILITCWSLAGDPETCADMIDNSDILLPFLVYTFVRCGATIPRLGHHLMCALMCISRDVELIKKLESFGAHKFLYQIAFCSDFTSIDYWMLDDESWAFYKMNSDKGLVRSASGDHVGYGSMMPYACRTLIHCVRGSKVMRTELLQLGLREKLKWYFDCVKEKIVLNVMLELQVAIDYDAINKFTGTLGCQCHTCHTFDEDSDDEDEDEDEDDEDDYHHGHSHSRNHYHHDHCHSCDESEDEDESDDEEDGDSDDADEQENINSASISERLSRLCSNCYSQSEEGNQLKKCGACMSVQYCGR